MFKHRFVFLLVALILLLLSGPIIHVVVPGTHSTLARVVFSLVFVLLLMSAVVAVGKRRRTMWIAWMIAIPACVFRCLFLAFDNRAIEITNNLLGGLFLLFTVAVILKYLFVADHVTFDMISAALCVYLLLGVAWAMAYSLIEILQPGSFYSALGEAGGDTLMRFEGQRAFLAIYYSFVTLTTLGYGDIVPTSSLARTFAALEALTGQLYLAVLVARLVGLHISQSTIRHSAP